MLTWEKLTLHFHNPFHVSYGVSETRDAFWIRLLGADGRSDEGWGEGTIPPYYRVDPSAMTDCWRAASQQSRAFPDEVEQIARWIPDGPAPARSALELALLDRIGKQRAIPLYKLLNLPAPAQMSSCFTIGIEEPATMAKQALQIADYPLIKLKLGSGDADDERRVAAVREARPDARLCIDANAGWSAADAIKHIKWLEKYNIELIEQPVAKDQHAAMGEVQKHTAIPVVGDESVQSLEDVEKLASAGVKGVNLKLMKLGGVLTAIKCLKRARELKMKIMLGCMIETSIGTTAMAHLSGMADWLDLDAPLLIKDDPFDGLKFDRNAKITVPNRPGIGAIQRESAQ
jgi:L-alanine-DL-glutamate epimerase-like enolase superfamily enzyme